MPTRVYVGPMFRCWRTPKARPLGDIELLHLIPNQVWAPPIWPISREIDLWIPNHPVCTLGVVIEEGEDQATLIESPITGTSELWDRCGDAYKALCREYGHPYVSAITGVLAYDL